MCGEKISAAIPLQWYEGSPPRVRGKVAVFEKLVAKIGITPACAGKRIPGQKMLVRRWDHPRVCGEKKVCGIWLKCDSGSPPRVRGKELFANVIVDVEGITPACAGKRRSLFSFVSADRDHPRVCGEKMPLYSVPGLYKGSPPRVRGKAVALSVSFPISGITPACAGKSRCSRLRCGVFRDHPRVCGEKHAI